MGNFAAVWFSLMKRDGSVDGAPVPVQSGPACVLIFFKFMDSTVECWTVSTMGCLSLDLSS